LSAFHTIIAHLEKEDKNCIEFVFTMIHDQYEVLILISEKSLFAQKHLPLVYIGLCIKIPILCEHVQVPDLGSPTFGFVELCTRMFPITDVILKKK
jgi:hypothetical protein